MNKYLEKFTSEDELVSEISNMEKLREYFISETSIIEHLKYIVYQEYHGDGRNKQSIQQKIEIYPPAIIDTFDYNNFVYDGIPHGNCLTRNLAQQTPAVKLYRDHIITKCHVDGIIPENVIETIYRIYVNRLKRERQLTKLIHDNGLPEMDCLKEINKRIENLYKKYADLLTYLPTNK
jgi:hypothetical protein